MKLCVIWLGTVAVFWLWFLVSLYDLGLGLFVLSPGFHESVMLLYGWTLGIEPAVVPQYFARAFAVDGALVLAILGFQRRQALVAWLAATRPRRGTVRNSGRT